MIVRELITRLGFEADEKKVTAFEGRVASLNKTLNRVVQVSTAVGIAAAGMFAKSFIQNTKDAEAEQAQLATVLRSTGEAAGFTIDKLNAMSDAIRKNSALDGGDITNAQIALLAFTNIAGDQFVKANQAAADMASRTGMSVVSAAELIGRALDVPSQGMAALSKQGFRFTEQEKKLIKQLEATGRTAEAQGIILKALEVTYGGAAEAASKTFGGTLIRLQQTIKDLMTGDSGSLSGLQQGLEGIITQLQKPEAKEAVDKLAGAIISLVLAGSKLVVRMVDAAEAIGGVERVVKVLASAIGILIGVKAAIWFAGLAKAVWAFNFALLANPLTWFVALIASVVAVIVWLSVKLYQWIDANDDLKNSIVQTFEFISTWIGDSIKGIGLMFDAFVNGLIAKWMKFRAFVSNPFKAVGQFLTSPTANLPNSGQVATQARSGMSRSPINMNVRNDVKISVPTGTTQEQAAAINSQVERQMRSVLAREVGAASLALEGM